MIVLSGAVAFLLVVLMIMYFDYRNSKKHKQVH